MLTLIANTVAFESIFDQIPEGIKWGDSLTPEIATVLMGMGAAYVTAPMKGSPVDQVKVKALDWEPNGDVLTATTPVTQWSISKKNGQWEAFKNKSLWRVSPALAILINDIQYIHANDVLACLEAK